MPDASFDAVAFVNSLTLADVPTGLPLGSGLTVTDPVAYLGDLREHVNADDKRHFLGVERAVELRDALAAYDGTPALRIHHLRKGDDAA